MSDYPQPAIVDHVLLALDPATADQDTKMEHLLAAMAINREETLGVIFGITAGTLDAIEERTHGLITGAEVYRELAEGIRCRMAAAMMADAGWTAIGYTDKGGKVWVRPLEEEA
jgi:hypothetical protein